MILIDAGTFSSPATEGPIDGGGADTPLSRLNANGLAEDWWEFARTDRIRTTGSQSDANVSDKVIRTTTSGTAYVEVQLGIAWTRGTVGGISYESSDTDVATVDSAGNVTHVADGSCSITIRDSLAVRTHAEPFATRAYDTSAATEYMGGITGSARKDADDAVDSRISGGTPSTDMPLFSVAYPTFTANVNSWLADVDMTCVSVWNSNGGYQRCGVLISPRHVIFAAHFPLYAGAVMWFVDGEGTVITRTITATEIHPFYDGSVNDIGVGVLNSDVPAGVAFAKVLPASYATYIPGDGDLIPVAWVDQNKRAYVRDISQIATAADMVVLTTPGDATRVAFSKSPVTYDSGTPVFMILGGEPVLLCVMKTTNTGTAVHEQLSAIDTMMSRLGGGYSTTAIDLSGYTSF